MPQPPTLFPYTTLFRSTKLDKMQFLHVEGNDSLPALNGQDLWAENMRKMFLAMAEDIRVVLIKLADRLQDRKSTRLNYSNRCISYAVFCLKKKNTINYL